MANFFAYFKPTERRNSRCILFLICCPAHLREKVKQELENDGITSYDTTSRRNMMPGCDEAFVFVSGGVRPAREEDMKDFYLRLVSKGRTRFCPKKNYPRRICINCTGAWSNCFRCFFLIWYSNHHFK